MAGHRGRGRWLVVAYLIFTCLAALASAQAAAEGLRLWEMLFWIWAAWFGGCGCVAALAIIGRWEQAAAAEREEKAPPPPRPRPPGGFDWPPPAPWEH